LLLESPSKRRLQNRQRDGERSLGSQHLPALAYWKHLDLFEWPLCICDDRVIFRASYRWLASCSFPSLPAATRSITTHYRVRAIYLICWRRVRRIYTPCSSRTEPMRALDQPVSKNFAIPSNATYSILARMLAARRDNLKSAHRFTRTETMLGSWRGSNEAAVRIAIGSH